MAALRDWLLRMEEAENHTAIEEVRGEETVPWEDCKGSNASNERATGWPIGGRNENVGYSVM